MLPRKVARDLWSQRWQVGAVVLVTLLGTAIFDAGYLAYRNLQRSYATTEARTHLAQVTIEDVDVTPDEVRRVALIPGVARAEASCVVDWPIELPSPGGGTARATGRLIAIPVGHQPALDQVVVVSGHYPSRANEILLERRFAEFHHLTAGSRVRVALPGVGATLRVAGVAVSAEYLWVARSRQEVLPSPADFGVLFAPREAIAEVARQALGAGAASSSPSLAPDLATLHIAAGEDGDRLLYDVEPTADRAAVLAHVTTALDATGSITATGRDDLVGVRLLRLDMDGLREFAVSFPVLFLVVAAFVVAALMARRVDQERAVIGTLMALGARPAQVLLHYVTYPAVIAFAGGGLGTAAGVWMAAAMTRSYADELGIPFVTTRVDWAILAAGFSTAVVFVILAGLTAARRAAAIAPAEAMRPFVRAAGHGRPPRRTSRGPLWLRMGVRDLARHPGRAVCGVTAIAAAIILVFSTAGLLDSMNHGLALTFGREQRYDLRADLLAPRPAAEVERRIAALPGVTTTEALLVWPVRVSDTSGTRRYDTILQGLPPGGALLEELDADGRPLTPGDDGAIVSRQVAKRLRVRPGDTIRVTAQGGPPLFSVHVGALSDSLFGNAITVPGARAAAALGLPGQATTILVAAQTGSRTAVRDALARLPDVVQVTDLAAIKAQTGRLTGLFYLFVSFLVLFAVTLAGTILFTLVTVGVLERGRELATLQALGCRMATITRLITAENCLLALAGIACGVPLGLLALWGFVTTSSSDLFSLPFHLSATTFSATLVSVFLVLLVAEWPVLRRVARTNVADAVKARE